MPWEGIRKGKGFPFQFGNNRIFFNKRSGQILFLARSCHESSPRFSGTDSWTTHFTSLKINGLSFWKACSLCEPSSFIHPDKQEISTRKRKESTFRDHKQTSTSTARCLKIFGILFFKKILFFCKVKSKIYFLPCFLILASRWSFKRMGLRISVKPKSTDQLFFFAFKTDIPSLLTFK